MFDNNIDQIMRIKNIKKLKKKIDNIILFNFKSLSFDTLRYLEIFKSLQLHLQNWEMVCTTYQL